MSNFNGTFFDLLAMLVLTFVVAPVAIVVGLISLVAYLGGWYVFTSPPKPKPPPVPKVGTPWIKITLGRH